jgi:hypothetical protein
MAANRDALSGGSGTGGERFATDGHADMPSSLLQIIHLLPVPLIDICSTTLSTTQEALIRLFHTMYTQFAQGVFSPGLLPRLLYLPSPAWAAASPAATSSLGTSSPPMALSLGLPSWSLRRHLHKLFQTPIARTSLAILLAASCYTLATSFPNSRLAGSLSWIYVKMSKAMAELLAALGLPPDATICVGDLPIPESKYGDLHRLKTAAELLAGENTSKVFADSIHQANGGQWMFTYARCRRSKPKRPLSMVKTCFAPKSELI